MRTEHLIVRENVKDEQPEEKGKAREVSAELELESGGQVWCRPSSSKEGTGGLGKPEQWVGDWLEP